jgi:uncharacterized protein (TIGR02466 family)
VTDTDDRLEPFTVLPIFPTLIWATQVRPEARQRINGAFMGAIEAAKARQPELRPAGKWQTDQRLHTLPELAEFSELVVGGARQILDSHYVRYRDIRITGCWANVGFQGSRHRPHAHPNNYFSGVYYVTAPAGGNTINFFDPRPQAAVMVPPVEKMSPMVAQSMTLDVQPGSLILFPSWLYHGVDVNRSTEQRISVAINLMFAPYVEDMSAPLWEGNLQVTPD